MAEHEPPQFSPEAAAQAEDPFVGRVIVDKFRMGRLLGVGAMGRVYEAEHLSLAKKVAVKVLHRHLMGDEGLARRFHREAKSASSLNHPNSIAIMDFGQDVDGTLYIAMEFLEGRSLLEVIHDAEDVLPLERTVKILSQVCLALDEAHHQNIVHRDLKAENVMVLERRDEPDFVKVCDFGIAKVQDPKADDPDSAITVAGMVCGTPEYMSPEQARGDRLDGRSDLYSLGILLYYMITDELPFTAETALGCVTKHLTEEPRLPREVRPDLDIPPILEEFVLRTISKDPDRRPATAAAFREELEEIAARIARGDTGTPVSTPSAELASAEPEQTRGGRTALIVAVVLLLLAAGAVAAFLLTRRPSSAPGGGGTHQAGLQPERGAGRAVDAGLRRPSDAGAAVVGRPADASPSVAAMERPGAADPPGRRRRRRRRARRPPGRPEPRPAMRRVEPRERPRPARSGFDEVYGQARAAFNAGQVGKALGLFRKALRLRPGHAPSLKAVGQCYVRLGQPCRALQYFKRYQAKRPGSYFIKRHIQTLSPKCGGK